MLYCKPEREVHYMVTFILIAIALGFDYFTNPTPLRKFSYLVGLILLAMWLFAQYLDSYNHKTPKD